MPSQALKEHRQKNISLRDAEALEGLAAQLDADPATEVVTSEEMEEHLEEKEEEFTQAANVDMPYETLDEAVDAHAARNAPYNALLGKAAAEVKVNRSPRPVNNWGQGTRPLDISGRIKPDGVYRGPDTAVTTKGEVLPPILVGNYDVVILAPSHSSFGDTVLVNAILDRINPEFIIHGGSNGADAMARAWAISRLGENGQAEFLANWDEDGPSAGPIRNGLMLDMGRDLMDEEGKSVCLLYFFVPDQFGRDRITDSMLKANAAQNAAYQSQPGLRDKNVIPAIDARAWMEDDGLAANPKDRRGKVEFDLPVPSSIR